MHALVCLKQVPRDNSVKINSDLSINAEGIEKIINLFDEYAVEEALAWNEKHGGKVTVLSIGQSDWADSLRRTLAMGATDARLLSDAAFAHLDSLGLARVAAAAIKKLGDVDVVFCGRNSTDDESGAFGPMLARLLGWPVLSYVGKVVELDPAGKRVVVERNLETVVETVATQLPAVITVIKDINQPRYPSLLKIKKVAKTEIPGWTAGDLGLSATDLQPVVTTAQRTPPPPRPKGEIIDGPDALTKVRTLVQRLKQNQII